MLRGYARKQSVHRTDYWACQCQIYCTPAFYTDFFSKTAQNGFSSDNANDGSNMVTHPPTALRPQTTAQTEIQASYLAKYERASALVQTRHIL